MISKIKRIENLNLFKKGLKKCTKCGLVLPLIEFTKRKNHGDGFFTYCKECGNKKAALWRKKNPEKVRQISQRTYGKNKDKILARGRKWRKENPEKVKAITKNWRKNNPEKVAASEKKRAIKRKNSPEYKVKRNKRNKELYQKNIVKKRVYYKKTSAEWRKKNKARSNEIVKSYYWRNRDRVLVRGKKWRKANLEKTKQTTKSWRKRNKGRVNDAITKRRLAQINRIPKWADLEAIKSIYINRPKDMVVDHVIPLQGKLVSGLHISSNLQYLTPLENASKNNKFTPTTRYFS